MLISSQGYLRTNSPKTGPQLPLLYDDPPRILLEDGFDYDGNTMTGFKVL